MLLLDTHVVLWWLAGARLERDARERIADPDTIVMVSAASVWEIAIKRALGKVRFDGSMAVEVERAGFTPLPIAGSHAEHAGLLPAHHRDPFDRMLIAQAGIERLTIATRDLVFDAYDIDVLRA